MSNPDMIMVPIEKYNDLKADSEMLSALLANGVDSWDGYDAAIESLGEDNE